MTWNKPICGSSCCARAKKAGHLEIERGHGPRIEQLVARPSGSRANTFGFFEQHLNVHLTLDGANLSTTQAAALRELFWVIWTCKDRMSALDAITQSDREAELEQWLEENGVEEAGFSPGSGNYGYSVTNWPGRQTSPPHSSRSS